MGLFDSFQFDPNSFDSGGLLANLRQQLQSNSQPSPLDNAQWPSGPQGNYGQTQNVAIGNYQMPQFGSPSPQQPNPLDANAQIPQNAQSAQYQPQQAAPQQQTQPSFLGPQEPGLVAKLAAGLSGFGAGGKTGGLVGALTSGLTGFSTGQSSDPRIIQQQNLKAQYDSVNQTLRNSGLSQQEASSKAMLAVLNPEAGKTILQEALTNKENFQQTGEDAFGNKQYGFVNNLNQTVNGQPINAAGGGQQSTSGMLASGVKQIDSNLKGADYLQQFSPEVQSAVQNYIDGKSTPTGNPRKGFTQAVKMIAQKVGDDTGQSVDDATFAARKQMRSQLSSSSPSSLGGQINIGNTAAGHLADLTEQALKLDNSDGFGIPAVAHVINDVRGMASTDQAAKMESLKGAAQHYGQEITKFYAGSPGGVAERDRFIESVNGAKSPKELAAILQTEGELMRSRLDALGGQIKGVLGEQGMQQYPVLRPDGEAALNKVAENVSRLKSGTQSTQQTSTAPDRSAIEAEMRRRGLIK